MKKRLQRYAFHIGHWTLRVSRWTLYASAAMLVLLAIVFTVARFLLPMLEERKPDLEQYLSQRSVTWCTLSRCTPIGTACIPVPRRMACRCTPPTDVSR